MSNVRRHTSIERQLREKLSTRQMQCNSSAPRGQARSSDDFAFGEPQSQLRLKLGAKCCTPRSTLASLWHTQGRTPSPCRPPVPQAGGRLTRVATWKNEPITKGSIAQGLVREAHCSLERRSQCKTQELPAFVVAQRVTPNPSIERTSTGMALQTLISFWALRALPVPAAHVKR